MPRRRLALAMTAAYALAATVSRAAEASGPASAKRAAGSALIQAAAQGDAAAVHRHLLASGAPLDARDASGRTALLAATQGRFVPIALELIACGADVNAQDSIQDSAFLLAGASGLTEIIRAALPKADPRVLNRYGGTALIPACHHGHVETVRVLLEWKGPNKLPIDHVNRLGWTALLEAIVLGDGGPRHTEIVRLLLAHGANANLPDREGVTPLGHAQRRSQSAIVELLRGAGAKA